MDMNKITLYGKVYSILEGNYGWFLGAHDRFNEHYRASQVAKQELEGTSIYRYLRSCDLSETGTMPEVPKELYTKLLLAWT